MIYLLFIILVFIEFYQTKLINYSSSKEFQEILSQKTTKDISWFFNDFLNTAKKIDYTIKSVKPKGDSLKVTIKNKRNITAPVALYGVKNKQINFKKWFTNIDSTVTVTIPKGDFDKLALNYENLYPEQNTFDLLKCRADWQLTVPLCSQHAFPPSHHYNHSNYLYFRCTCF